uniref:Uncharacterized protein n=1 Tax=Prevotella sp. GTC17254 TaxID=3236794 RepID=A0AB33IWY3_9BACT
MAVVLFLITFASAYENNAYSAFVVALKKEFFEKIYIDREVVQEATLPYFFDMVRVG